MTLSSGVPATFDIERFIAETKFSGYQQITLPSGRIIPGTDRSPVADLIYPSDLTGKSVLDVGCYYGFFLHEAIRRGAQRAVGIEADAERFHIASTLAPLWEGKVRIHEGLLENVELDQKFDVVLFLNVLHHVKDPLEVIRKLADLCRGTLVVEFRQPHDSQFVMECFHRNRSRKASSGGSLVRRGAHRLRMAVETRLVERVARELPIVGVGSVEYHRSYFFSKQGFKNMFQVHNRLFRDIEFRPSKSRGQILAFCQCGE
ncbi:MAG TPA: methyltransferase domain-containing protein [Gemmatimonadales bacterium]|nr:methyltransferase domain-containing protein [Gemmatimonadales bacterium]